MYLHLIGGFVANIKYQCYKVNTTKQILLLGAIILALMHRILSELRS